MQNPIGVADGLLWTHGPNARVGQAGFLGFQEGRTRPGHAVLNVLCRFQPWIKPVTAKPASSQGEALATTEGVHNSTKPN